MKKVILAALALVPALAFATPGAYVQAQAGGNMVDFNVSGVNNATGFAGGIGAGYLWGDSAVNYGLEVDGLWYPDTTTTQSGTTLKINGYNLSLLGVLKYTDCTSGFTIFGKAGGAYVNQTYSGDGLPGDTSGNSIDPEVAAGVGYQFTPNWEVDLTGDWVFGHSGAQTSADIDPWQNGNLTLGLVYRFA